MSDSDRGLSRAQIEKQLDASLKRLRTDYVDLYQCHRYESDTPLEETMEALTRAVESGKTRYIGFSEWPADRIQAAIDLSDRGVAKFVSSQPQYSLLWREPEDEVIPLCAANGISQIVWSPLGQGVLSGKYDPDSPPPRGHARGQRGDGRLHGPADAARRAARGAAAEADRRGSRADPAAVRARLGAARAQRRLGDHRRVAARAGARECRRPRASIVDTQLFLSAEAIIDEALGGAERLDHLQEARRPPPRKPPAGRA